MPSLLQKLSFFDPETGRTFVRTADGFYWKEAKSSPKTSSPGSTAVNNVGNGHSSVAGDPLPEIKIGDELEGEVVHNPDVEFKKMFEYMKSLRWAGMNPWYPDKYPWFTVRIFGDGWIAKNELAKHQEGEGETLDELKKFLSQFRLNVLGSKPKPKTIDMPGLVHKGTARTIMHDDSGAQTGLRDRPDYGESDSHTSEMNEANSKGASILVLDGGVKTANGIEKKKLYVSAVSYEPGDAFKLAAFRFSVDPKKAIQFPPKTAANLAGQIFSLYGAKAKLAKPSGGGLITTQNIKTQKPYQPSLITDKNVKTQKGEDVGYLTGVMHLMPSDLAGYGNVCPCASPECREMCLNTAGMWANSKAVQNSRRMKTELYFKNRPQFMADLRKSIQSLVRKAEKLGLKPAIRINGTSDLPQVAMEMAKEFPQVQFYDYTKIPQPWKRQAPNYHITFSRSEINEKHALEALKHGVNVAVVFGIAKGEPLPKEWKGYQVLDGDLHDLRFLDRLEGKGPFIVGLRGKGKARGKDKGTESGFVVDVKPLVQIAPMKQEDKPKTSAADNVPHVQWYVEGCFDDAHLSV